MSKDKISQYSTTNALNTDIGGIDIDENCLPSNLNDAIREVMVQLKEFQDGSSGDSLTIAGLFTAGNVDINGGAIDGTAIGASSASAGAFTNFSASGTAQFTSTGAVKIPVGTTAQRTSGDKGEIRFNDDADEYEGYYGTEWKSLGGTATTLTIENRSGGFVSIPLTNGFLQITNRSGSTINVPVS